MLVYLSHRANHHHPHMHSTDVHCLVHISSSHPFPVSILTTGIRGTYQGLVPTILKQGSNQAIRFFVYGTLRKHFQKGDNAKDVGAVKTFISGGLAGAASVFGNTPIDVVKTRLQVTM